MRKITNYKIPSYVYIMWLSLVLAIPFGIYEKDWMSIFISLVVLSSSIYAIKLCQEIEFKIPSSLITASIIFIYASLFLGEVHNFYGRFWWWDSVLHASSAIGFGLIGATILVLMTRQGKVKASPAIISIFVFSFALAIGAVWEIFEYFMDQFFGMNMQKDGLHDTMKDLIVDTFGALIATAVSYLYFSNNKIGILSSVIDEAVTKNTTK